MNLMDYIYMATLWKDLKELSTLNALRTWSKYVETIQIFFFFNFEQN